jgi:hypothetical protein
MELGIATLMSYECYSAFNDFKIFFARLLKAAVSCGSPSSINNFNSFFISGYNFERLKSVVSENAFTATGVEGDAIKSKQLFITSPCKDSGISIC